MIWAYIPQLLSGVWLTAVLVFFSVLVGFSLATLFTVLHSSNKAWLQWPINSYIFVIRGTPLLVQIFLIYYGLGQFPSVTNSVLWPILQQPLSCAILALAINTSAYTTELLLAAKRAIPTGEIEACKSLGMSPWVMAKRVIAPRTIGFVLPAYSNEVIMLLKASSLASTITLLDLMGMTQQIISQTYASTQFLLVAAVLYLCLNGCVMGLFRLAERRFFVLESQ